MSNNTVADLFNVRSHNPSFFSVEESAVYKGPLLDFCIPVNLHFPPPQMVQRISEHLPEILRYYPDYAEVHAKHIGEIAERVPASRQRRRSLPSGAELRRTTRRTVRVAAASKLLRWRPRVPLYSPDEQHRHRLYRNRCSRPGHFGRPGKSSPNGLRCEA